MIEELLVLAHANLGPTPIVYIHPDGLEAATCALVTADRLVELLAAEAATGMPGHSHVEPEIVAEAGMMIVTRGDMTDGQFVEALSVALWPGSHEIVRSEQVHEQVVLDFDPHGNLVGVEILPPLRSMTATPSRWSALRARLGLAAS